jgi:hypothetical protein
MKFFNPLLHMEKGITSSILQYSRRRPKGDLREVKGGLFKIFRQNNSPSKNRHTTDICPCSLQKYPKTNPKLHDTNHHYSRTHGTTSSTFYFCHRPFIEFLVQFFGPYRIPIDSFLLLHRNHAKIKIKPTPLEQPYRP